VRRLQNNVRTLDIRAWISDVQWPRE
jgi:hypothetical protein